MKIAAIAQSEDPRDVPTVVVSKGSDPIWAASWVSMVRACRITTVVYSPAMREP